MDFITVTPRETAGSLTSSRYDFQKDLSLAMLLEYHDRSNDYLFIFDYHDDLVLMDSEKNPSNYSFFQIKTKSKGTFTLNTILKRRTNSAGKELNSILGKLYGHKEAFPDKVKELALVSNVPYTVADETKGKTITHEKDFCLTKLSKNDCDKIVTSLKKELNLTTLPDDFFNISFFRITSLSTTDSKTHVTGILSKFLYDKGIVDYSPELVYRTLFDEIKIKTAYSKLVTSFEELKEKKGIGKTFFADLLDSISSKKNFAVVWNQINGSLQSAGLQFGDIALYRDQWKRYEVECMNPTNNVHKECLKQIRASIAAFKKNNEITGMNVLQMIQGVKAILARLPKNDPYEEKYIDTLIISLLHE